MVSAFDSVVADRHYHGEKLEDSSTIDLYPSLAVMYTCQYVSNEQLVSELQQLWLDINGEAVTADKVRTELQTVCRSNQDNLEGQVRFMSDSRWSREPKKLNCIR